jgi:hypothetical protein
MANNVRRNDVAHKSCPTFSGGKMKVQKITVQRIAVAALVALALGTAFLLGTGSSAQAKPDALLGKPVRAQVVVTAGSSGGINRCMNGPAKTTIKPCNFAVTKNGTGDYTIDFNFQVNNGFFQVTPWYAASTPVVAIVYSTPAPDQIRVKTFNGTSAIDSAFFLTVF